MWSEAATVLAGNACLDRDCNTVCVQWRALQVPKRRPAPPPSGTPAGAATKSPQTRGPPGAKRPQGSHLGEAALLQSQATLLAAVGRQCGIGSPLQHCRQGAAWRLGSRLGREYFSSCESPTASNAHARGCTARACWRVGSQRRQGPAHLPSAVAPRQRRQPHITGEAMPSCCFLHSPTPCCSA